MSFSEDMRALASELTLEFSEGKTCDVVIEVKEYDPSTGHVGVSSSVSYTVPQCFYDARESYYRGEDFLKASKVLVVSGEYLAYEDIVPIGSKVILSDGSEMRVCAKYKDMYNSVFEFGIKL